MTLFFSVVIKCTNAQRYIVIIKVGSEEPVFHSIICWVKNSRSTASSDTGAEGKECTSEGEEDKEKEHGRCRRTGALEREQRNVHLPDLLQYVRLPLLSAKFLTDVVDDEVGSNY